MSEKAQEVLIAFAVMVAAVAVIAFLWGLFIYNNNQNIKRDEFIASHCQKISEVENGWGGYNYRCGTTK